MTNTNPAIGAKTMFKHARAAEQPQDAFNLKQWQQVGWVWRKGCVCVCVCVCVVVVVCVLVMWG